MPRKMFPIILIQQLRRFQLSWQLGLTGLELTQAVSDLAAFLISGTIMVHYFLKEFGKERV